VTTRAVRVTADLFHQLETQLPADRGPAGEPTVAEFASTDLLDIVEAFATRWDDLPATIPGRWDYRTLMTRARLAYAVAVSGQLSPVDGAIELTGIAIDLRGPDPHPDDFDEHGTGDDG
jgi:hypothetical protein